MSCRVDCGPDRSVSRAVQVITDLRGPSCRPRGDGVIRAERGLRAAVRPFGQEQRLGVASEAAVGGGEVAEADGGGGVVGAEGCFGDGEGAPVEGEGVGVASEVAVGGGEVAEADGGGGVVGAEGCFGDGEGAPVEGEGVGVASERVVEGAEVAEAAGPVRSSAATGA
jgi:hypothetical protein